MQLYIGSLCSLLTLQRSNWRKSISPPLRFILCGISSYISFSIYELLKGVSLERQNSLLIEAFGEPSLFVLIGYLLILGYMGLYFSLVSVALFSSLLPKA